MHHFWIIRLQGGQEEQADAGPTQRVEPLVGRVVGLVRNGFGCPSGLWVFPKSSDKQILFRDDPQRIGSLSDLWQIPDIFVKTQ